MISKRMAAILGVVILAVLMPSCSAAKNQAKITPTTAATAQPAQGQPQSTATDSSQKADNSNAVSAGDQGKDVNNKEQHSTGPASPAGKQDVTAAVFAYLEAQVPEIATYGGLIASYNQSNQTAFKQIIRIDEYPDPKAADVILRDYYLVYVGEGTGDHTNRWNSFYVRNDLKEILVDDPLSGNTAPLATWRQRIKNEANGQ